jgi:hypothetical protein
MSHQLAWQFAKVFKLAASPIPNEIMIIEARFPADVVALGCETNQMLLHKADG